MCVCVCVCVGGGGWFDMCVSAAVGSNSKHLGYVAAAAALIRAAVWQQLGHMARSRLCRHALPVCARVCARIVENSIHGPLLLLQGVLLMAQPVRQ